ncbi:hypothetical protein LOD99_11811 [Oopsacas minuta]|uniref:G-protein coupled receptors family 1 profile domain-containing protein n=1 Tax=Oopsacas minuta TaxID=111878 RepID=A0AAV7JL05_9METZ|nr:hypothetical protein LOD99_11811 [Oopsacas minuta]
MNNSSNQHTELHILKKTSYIEKLIGVGLILTYIILCLVWLPYIIARIFSRIRNKRRLITLMSLDSSCDYTYRLFVQKEDIFRYVIFLIFLCFELICCLSITIYGVIIELKLSVNVSPVGPNCSVNSKTFSSFSYDIQKFLLLFDAFSFSMMIWLFGALLLHLSFAARNELKIQIVLRFILFGILINLTILIFSCIRYTSIFGVITQSLMDQISFFIVLYITKKRFFPAMNSRVIDAYHLHSTNVYLQQKRLFKQYKVIVFVFLFLSELVILKCVCLYDLYAIIETISLNPCWFQVTYHLPILMISESSKDTLTQISSYCLVFNYFIDLLIYCIFMTVNLNIMYVTAKRCIKSRFYDRERYRYHVCSDPLLS